MARGILDTGILRALQADSNIEFHNEQSGDQFRVIFRRTIQKGETTQKTTQETDIETHSEEKRKDKTDIESQSKENSKEKTDIKTDTETNVADIKHDSTDIKTVQRSLIIEWIKANPKISLDELTDILKVTRSSVQRRMESLIKEGKIRHIGPKKGGHWEVEE